MIRPHLRIPILLLILLLLAAIAINSRVSQAASPAADHGLFAPVAAPAGATSSFGPEIVRGRMVTINQTLLQRTNGVPGAAVLPLNLFSDTAVLATREQLIHNRSGSTTWIGHIAGEPAGQAILTISGEQLFGHLSLPTGTYTIAPANEATGTHLITQIDDDQLLMGESDARLPAEAAAADPAAPVDAQSISDASDGTVLDVLIIYTDDVATNVGAATLQGYVDNYIAYTNQAYANSNITQRIQLVGFEEILYDEPDNLDDALEDITPGVPSGSPTTIPAVEAFRDEYHADLVVFIIDLPNCSGLAWVNGLSASHRFGHSTMTACSFGSAVFAHELGHNMGSNHDWYVNASLTPFPYGHGYVDITAPFRTIMAYNNRCSAVNGSGCATIPHFSNPAVLYGGRPTGVASGSSTSCTTGQGLPPTECDADAHRVFNETAAHIDGFRDSAIVWTGATSTSWTDASNWVIQEGAPGATSPINRVPRTIDDVLIPAAPTGSRFPTLNGSAAVRDLTLESGATLSISGGTLTVYGRWTEQGSAETSATGGAVIFAGNIPQTITTGPNSTFYHLQIGDGGSTKVQLNSDIDVNGDLTLRNLATLSAGTHTIKLAGSWDEQSPVAFAADTGTVILDGSAQTVDKTTTTAILNEDFSEGDGKGCGCNTAYLPPGWTRQGAWFGGSSGGSGVGYAFGNGWLHSVPVNLVAGVDYNLTFEFNQQGGSDTLLAYYGTAANSASQTNLIGSISSSGTADFDFTVATSGTYYIGFHHDGDGTSTMDNVVLTASQPLGFYNLQISNGSSLAVNQRLMIANDLTINAGGLLDLTALDLTVEGAVLNSGTLRETRPVAATTPFLMIENAAADSTRYFGLELLNPAGNMGSTTVTIAGGQTCGVGSGSFMARCFTVTPTTSQTADLRFWFTEGERSGLFANLTTAARWNGAGWVEASSTGATTRSETTTVCSSNGGRGCWIEAAAVTGSGSFALGGGESPEKLYLPQVMGP